MSMLAALILLASAQAAYDPFETRRPESRERMLKYGGGSAETEAALAKALAWLTKAQKPDGSWDATEDQFTVGMTGLSLLAFLGAGHSPASADYGAAIQKGIKYLRSVQDADGCVGAQSGKCIVNHAIATAAIAEARAMSSDHVDLNSAQKAVNFLLVAQNPGLGWRYVAQGGDNDTHVTAWAVCALYSAEQGLLAFPKTTYESAMAWLEKITDDAGRARYIVNPQAMIPGRDEMFDFHPTPTAMSMLSRRLMTKVRRSPPLLGGTKILAKDLPRWGKTSTDYCYWYFGSLALYMVDGPEGETWKAWNEALKPALLKHQVVEGKEAGSWDPVDRWSTHLESRVYATAINALTLETYYRYVKFFRGDEK